MTVSGSVPHTLRADPGSGSEEASLVPTLKGEHLEAKSLRNRSAGLQAYGQGAPGTRGVVEGFLEEGVYRGQWGPGQGGSQGRWKALGGLAGCGLSHTAVGVASVCVAGRMLTSLCNQKPVWIYIKEVVKFKILVEDRSLSLGTWLSRAQCVRAESLGVYRVPPNPSPQGLLASLPLGEGGAGFRDFLLSCSEFGP